jgi:hypothetical protein
MGENAATREQDRRGRSTRWRLLLLWLAGNVAVSTLAWLLVSLLPK